MQRKLYTILGTVGIFVAFVALIMLLGSLRPKMKTEEPVIIPPTVFYQTTQPRQVTLDVDSPVGRRALGAVGRRRVEERQLEVLREAASDRALAGPGRSVDDDQARRRRLGGRRVVGHGGGG